MKIFSFFATFFFSLFLLTDVQGAFRPEEANYDYKVDGIYLHKTTVKELEQLYEIYGYKDYIYMRDWVYPPIFLTRLPTDFREIKDPQKRNKLFLQIVGPLALRLKTEMEEERLEILLLEQKFRTQHNLTPQEEKLIEQKAQKYDIFTRLKGERRFAYYFKELDLRVDNVPPSILIAIAAIESNWGSNRPANEGQSLYRELLWYSDEKGLIPQDEAEDKSYKYKIFPSLLDSMRSYTLKFNSGINYQQARFLRKEQRDRNKAFTGRNGANAMIFESSLPNFAGILDYTVTFYELTNFDEASLGDSEWLDRKLTQILESKK